MKNRLVYVAGDLPALRYAVEELENRGIKFAQDPRMDVTDLLLGVPCKMTGVELERILTELPKEISIFGGFLDRPELVKYRCHDLLKMQHYQAKNAMITAFCALSLAEREMKVTWEDCPVLVLGWGRIGKCLSGLLKNLGARVSVATRKETDQAMLAALGCEGLEIGMLGCILRRYRVIFNTVPNPILSRSQTALCRDDCVLVELASSPGMDGERVLDGRGLPGKMAPESSGKLIARTVLGLWAREDGVL